MISFKNVSKAFGNNQVLENLSLDINEGETITIIGGSGSGKSVLLKLLLDVLRTDKGHIFFKGRDITAMNDWEIIDVRKNIGMLFQGAALFDSLNVGENIAYPLREHFKYSEDKIKKIVSAKLDLVGLSGLHHMMPADLSGGMKKRVGLARAIATDPAVILYDEPTTGLDPANTMRINRLIRELQRKLHVTSIVVTHDMASAFLVSDRLAMLYNKRIEFVGTPEEAKKSPNNVVQHFIQGYIGEEGARDAG
ncbi:MAG: ABC transporter ATP-binding protein [Deltaproteobacteria bacterium]|nr:ABC transporter ATP-binding protein [Deltaproteobacteria bacterium]MBI2974098.1 ABC transporter ATP-binding protein [Deltaproteobacteria bacterium]